MFKSADMPDLRRAILRPTQALAGTADALTHDDTTIEELAFEYLANGKASMETWEFSHEDHKRVRHASLYWVTDQMSDLAASAAADMPQWTPIMCAPEPHGVMRIKYSIAGMPPALHQEFIVAWTTREEDIFFAVFRFFEGEVFLWSTHSVDPYDQYPLDNIYGERELDSLIMQLGAAWILMQQPSVAQPRVQKVPTSVTKTGKKRPPKPQKVQIINLRRLPSPSSEDDEKTESEGREYHHRWLVRGHWRQQRVGPGRKYTRPVYIAPHIRGPEGAPLKEDRVNVWNR